VEFEAGVSEELVTILFDPQTAGGLLISVAASDAQKLLTALNDQGVPALEIGEVLASRKPPMSVTA
jgi:selenide,water dikinase